MALGPFLNVRTGWVRVEFCTGFRDHCIDRHNPPIAHNGQQPPPTTNHASSSEPAFVVGLLCRVVSLCVLSRIQSYPKPQAQTARSGMQYGGFKKCLNMLPPKNHGMARAGVPNE